ncbi:molybdopterin converting factor small subunit [Leucobacter exalbidus]|uniref:Molybdopterin converting factor small subunit n=1 Tax=Leucobacter exalbidus TaxID=662960 RepID=A0A940T5M8_9MICO|nr:MoaD/ThiS family protein [Leucobacter exalbidus]MBP1326146.1 molybdopterin converting factor small subunit [Leucobacter exalbidus]
MSQITIRYFAAAAEAAGLEEELWEAETLAQLRGELTEKYGAAMSQVLRAGSFLVDGVVRKDDGPIGRSGLTVDVLPPFAGG